MATGTILGLTATQIAAGAAVAGAAVAGASAIAQNQANQRTAKAQRNAYEVQDAQLKARARQERLKAQRTADVLRGRLRAGTAESGAVIDPTSSLFTQLSQDEIQNLNIIDENVLNQRNAARAGSQINLADIESRYQNPLFAGLQGGVAGLSTGLAIGGYANGGPAQGAPKS